MGWGVGGGEGNLYISTNVGKKSRKKVTDLGRKKCHRKKSHKFRLCLKLLFFCYFFKVLFSLLGGPRGRVVKVADFSALDHLIISPLWVRASLGAEFTCGTSQVLLAGVPGGFPRVLRFRPTY